MHPDVAKGALRVLARAATGLPTQQVVQLLLEMARAGMGQELNALAAVLSAPGVRKAPEVVALAAAVAPDEALCQQTLQQAGLVALAACFTYNWCAIPGSSQESFKRCHHIRTRSRVVCKHIVTNAAGFMMRQSGSSQRITSVAPHAGQHLSCKPRDDLNGAGGPGTLCRPSRSGSSS